MESALVLPTKLSLTALVSLPYDAYVTIQSEQRLENAHDRPITCMSILGCFLGRISIFRTETYLSRIICLQIFGFLYVKVSSLKGHF